MKVVHFSTYDSGGGAAKAAYRLFEAQKLLKYDATFQIMKSLTQQTHLQSKNSHLYNLYTKYEGYVEMLPLLFYPNRQKYLFSCNPLPGSADLKINASLFHLHWVQNSFFSIEQISNVDKPIVWTLHDSWAFTGGCHLPFDCIRYKNKCGKCPMLGSKNEHDLSYLTFLRKTTAWKNANITLVSPSYWLAKKVHESSLFANNDIHVIPNPLDTNLFKPSNQNKAKKFFNINPNDNVILFGAMYCLTDKNKGYLQLNQALNYLQKKKKLVNTILVTFGEENKKALFSSKIRHLNVGKITQEKIMSKLYNAADVMVVPSLIENLPYTVMESLSCGTPVVAFSVGGIPELIKPNFNGYLVKPYNSKLLGDNIIKAIKKTEILGLNARKDALKKFNQKYIAKKYINLYKKIFNK